MTYAPLTKKLSWSFLRGPMWAQLRWSMGRNRSKMRFIDNSFGEILHNSSKWSQIKKCFQWKFAIFWCSRITSKNPLILKFHKKKNGHLWGNRTAVHGMSPWILHGHLIIFANETPKLKQSQLLFLPSPCQPALPLLLLLTAANLETCNANRQPEEGDDWTPCHGINARLHFMNDSKLK